MQNPLESEEAAFRFVLGTLVYFAPIVIAAWIATWLGVIVFFVMSVVAFGVVRRGTASAPPVVSTERAAVEDTRRILVIIDTLPIGPGLRDALLSFSEPATEDVLLICAVAPSAAGSGHAEVAGLACPDALETALHELRAAGINARGSIAARDPLHAIEEALREFDADEVVIAVDNVATAARSLFDGPVTEIAAESREMRS